MVVEDLLDYIAQELIRYNWICEAADVKRTGVIPYSLCKEVGGAISDFVGWSPLRDMDDYESDLQVGRRLGRLRAAMAVYNVQQRSEDNGIDNERRIERYVKALQADAQAI